jgi:hypothetical protein
VFFSKLLINDTEIHLFYLYLYLYLFYFYLSYFYLSYFYLSNFNSFLFNLSTLSSLSAKLRLTLIFLL